MQKTNNSLLNWNYVVLGFVALLFTFLFSTTTSPLYEGWRFWYGGDSAIFQEMGYCILYGRTPYVDFFDHKGPLLFFPQALGLLINRHWGIMFLQTILLSLSLIFWYKTIKLFESKQVKTYSILFFILFILFTYYQRGNTSEEWCLPAISASIYLFFKRQQDNKNTNIGDWFFYGLCIGYIFMIRANSSAPIVGLLCYYLFEQLKEKQYTQIAKCLCILLCSILSFIGIITILFYIAYGKNATSEMLYGTFVFNILYLNAPIGKPTFLQILKFILPIVIFISVILFSIRHHPTQITIPLITAIIITMLSCGTRCFEHYIIIFIPLFSVSISLIGEFKLKEFIQTSILLFICFITVKPTLSCLITRFFYEKDESSFTYKFHNFILSMPENEKGSIYNYNASIPVYYFVNDQLLQYSRIAFPAHYTVSPRLVQFELHNRIYQKKPKWIIVKEGFSFTQNDSSFINENYYIADTIEDRYTKAYCFKSLL